MYVPNVDIHSALADMKISQCFSFLVLKRGGLPEDERLLSHGPRQEAAGSDRRGDGETERAVDADGVQTEEEVSLRREAEARCPGQNRAEKT